MLSRYKQNQAFTEDILSAVERFLAEIRGREGACDELERWSEADLHPAPAGERLPWRAFPQGPVFSLGGAGPQSIYRGPGKGGDGAGGQGTRQVIEE
ncbi:hypothetical protein THAOC_06947 [Thalassiosira oceanica]|uniref:Uncharacterized protein n=1 Tax=Thalassiosira oceanica TaxID=159749 RepID=K0TDN1_THAOC|nr:hypothetical protein THAOC_06947 [Thalassiosira oceanica]|eukprot:EJK71596.1 hypothetical protein THAOC_06947 [Thalassiosira oceanica]